MVGTSILSKGTYLRIGRVGGGATDIRYFLLDIEGDRTTFINLGFDLEADTDILTLDCTKWVSDIGTGTGGLAGNKWHILADYNFRFLVIHGHERRRRQ